MPSVIEHMRANYTRIIRFGRLAGHDVFAKVRIEAGRLSIVGVHGPTASGNAYGSCGQITDTVASIVAFAPGWDAELRDRFVTFWCRWHLNDMRAGTPAQEEFLRTHVPVNKPADRYLWACAELRAAGLNPDKSHTPDGIERTGPTSYLADGYIYGTRWLREALPDSVLAELPTFPVTDKQPAWV